MVLSHPESGIPLSGTRGAWRGRGNVAARRRLDVLRTFSLFDMASTSFAAPVGEILDGKFKVTKEIGRGGMATVYSAEHVGIGKQVAVKILASELATSRTVTERFLREARAAARIQSPYICEVYDVGTYEDRPFIVMELLQGESLYDRLARERTLSIEETLRIAVQTARGLKKAHELQVVHRDLKPENVFLTHGEDGVLQTKLVDFGLAKFYEPHLDPANHRLTKEGALFGTPAYMSPEQAKAKGNVDQRSDLWALGCIVFEMLTGRTVWDVEQGVAMILAQIATAPLPQPRAFRPDLPPQFDAWFARALARDVELRFQDADEFVAELRAALSPAEQSQPGLYPRGPAAPSTPYLTAPHPPPYPTPRGGNGGAQAKRPSGHTPSRPPSPPWSASLPRDNIEPPQDGGPVSGNPRRKFWGYAALAFVAGASIGAFLYAGGLERLRGSAGGAGAESSPYAAEIGEAQSLLAEGEVERSLELLRTTFDKGQGKATRSLLAHASVASEKQAGPCRLTGIGHPRPFESATESSAPWMAETPNGLLVTWADKEADQETTQARFTLLDDSLRRIAPIGNLTPEANQVLDPQLFAAGEHLGIGFSDFDGNKPGAFARLLNADGSIKAAPELLSTNVAKHAYNLAVASEADGTHWAVWVEPSRDRVFDLVVSKLDAELRPQGKPIAITGYATPSKGKTQADRPSIAVTDRLVMVSYTLRRNNKQQLILLRVAKEKLKAGGGVVPDNRTAAPGDEESDRFLGQALPLSDAPNNHDQSVIRCARNGNCFVAWDDAQNAGFVALVAEDGRVVWRKKLAPGSARPGIELNGEGGLLGWYENKRVQIAQLTASGPGEPTAVGRITAVLQQPPPLLVHAKKKPGRWYVAWRGYEAAVQEPFIARADCP
jgi:eukaryotic-like serine/threonine-protein kinase